ncbi:hypothetical protein [Myceligenerans halotolerans]
MIVDSGARLVVVPGADHFVRRDAPPEFVGATTDFLTDVARR